MGIMVILTLVNVASAFELTPYKKANKVIRDISDKDFERLMESTVAVCVKNGSSIKTVNKTFKDMRLKYADCSTSEKAQRRHAKLGIKVVVLPLYSLSSKYAKRVNNL